MAQYRETLRLAGGIRIRVGETVDAITDDLVRSWAFAWTQVVEDWEDAIADLQDLKPDGSWPARAEVLRAARVEKALQATYRGLLQLSERAGISIIGGVTPVIEAAAGQLDVIASQAPASHRAELRTQLIRADTEQIRSIVIRTQEQVTKTIFGTPAESFERIRAALVRGVAQGQGPATAARALVRGLEQAHSWALTRALVVTRTELLDAHRNAAMAHDLANADVLQEWRWTTAVSMRTCPACLAMDGQTFPITEPGPLGHAQCRCVRVPITKSWKDLGFNITEPPSMEPNAGEWFEHLSSKQQRGILGPERHDAWQAGNYPMSDWAERRSNPGWRDSYNVTQPPRG